MTKSTSSQLTAFIASEIVARAASEGPECICGVQVVFCLETVVCLVGARGLSMAVQGCSAIPAVVVLCAKPRKGSSKRLCSMPSKGLHFSQVFSVLQEMEGELRAYFARRIDSAMAVDAQVVRVGWCLACALNARKAKFHSAADVRHWVWRTAKNLRLRFSRDIQASLLHRGLKAQDEAATAGATPVRSTVRGPVDLDKMGHGDLHPNQCEPSMMATPEDLFLMCEWGHPDSKIRAAMLHVIDLLDPRDVFDFCVAHPEMWDGPVPHRLIQGKARALQRMAKRLATLGVYDYEDLEVYLEELAGQF